MSRLLRICMGLLLAVPLPALVPPMRRFAFEGRVTDGRRGLPGCRVFPDRLHRPPGQAPATPVAVTDAHGRFTLELQAGDAVLAVEKAGWTRDLAPLQAFQGGLALRPRPDRRVERVLVVRLDPKGARPALDDARLRARLFSREPNASSAANYLEEVSKGALGLEEGAFQHLALPPALARPVDKDRNRLARFVVERLLGQPLGDLDQVDNATGAPRPDGKPDHLWIFLPGPARAVTSLPAHLTPLCFMLPVPGRPGVSWPVVVATAESPIGLLVHEAFHAMGEHRADDLYLDCEHPMTAGIWDLMDAGQYRGWDAPEPSAEGWMDGIGASPSQPGPWVRADLWYRGRFAATVPIRDVGGRSWEGWLDPLLRAPGEHPQALRIPDPRRAGTFWELSVRRPWGFDAGRVGGRWGPGHEGLVVARVDPSLLTDGEPLGPVHVIDAHPGTPRPATKPRLPCGRHELDDAAFNLGPGENPAGSDGALAWEVLAVDGLGRMKVRVRLAAAP
ncbi:MAG: carboxypeptidase-like regulatory domain-containing protein [Holophagaceae bacterium]